MTRLALVAEDHSSLREQHSITLRALGFAVVAVDNGLDADRYATDRKLPWDLLLLDNRMPRHGHCRGITGLDILKEIRGMGLAMPAILCSGDDLAEEAAELSAHFVSKGSNVIQEITEYVTGLLGDKVMP